MVITTTELKSLGDRFYKIMPDGIMMSNGAFRLMYEMPGLKLYTLSVIDEDGSITGQKGRVIADSKEIPCPIDIESIKDLKIGEGIWIWKTEELPKKWDHTPYIVHDIGMFELTLCAASPCNIVDTCEAFWIWKRIV